MPIAYSAIPGLVVLGFITKQADQATRNKTSSTPPLPLHELLPLGFCPVCEFLPWLPLMIDYKVEV